ncbi:hypothetical protein LCGC14_1040250, partial [marine sediment metagenome]
MSDKVLRFLKKLMWGHYTARQKRKGRRRKASAASGPGPLKGCLILFVLMFSGFVGICGGILSESDTPEARQAQAERERCASTNAAFVYSKEFVKNRLQSPATAEFPYYSGAAGVEIETVECGRSGRPGRGGGGRGRRGLGAGLALPRDETLFVAHLALGQQRDDQGDVAAAAHQLQRPLDQPPVLLRPGPDLVVPSQRIGGLVDVEEAYAVGHVRQGPVGDGQDHRSCDRFLPGQLHGQLGGVASRRGGLGHVHRQPDRHGGDLLGRGVQQHVEAAAHRPGWVPERLAEIGAGGHNGREVVQADVVQANARLHGVDRAVPHCRGWGRKRALARGMGEGAHPRRQALDLLVGCHHDLPAEPPVARADQTDRLQPCVPVGAFGRTDAAGRVGVPHLHPPPLRVQRLDRAGRSLGRKGQHRQPHRRKAQCRHPGVRPLEGLDQVIATVQFDRQHVQSVAKQRRLDLDRPRRPLPDQPLLGLSVVPPVQHASLARPLGDEPRVDAVVLPRRVGRELSGQQACLPIGDR